MSSTSIGLDNYLPLETVIDVRCIFFTPLNVAAQFYSRLFQDYFSHKQLILCPVKTVVYGYKLFTKLAAQKDKAHERQCKMSSQKTWPVKELCGRQVFTCLRPRTTTQERGEGGRVEPERRGQRGNSSQSWVENTNKTDCISNSPEYIL